jgi:1-acyl-sn-glycerol-3-phosphate acyltransferase
MNYDRPTAREIARARALFLPLRALFSPVFFDLHKVPTEGPRLFVGNHTLLGALDVPHLFWQLLDERGVWLRGLGDHAHFNIPGWGDMLGRWGIVDGTPDNCARLFEQGEAVLVFPGGAREVAKRKGEQYELIWKRRTGFARLAIEHQATIIPFGALGADDAWDIVADADDLLQTPAGPVIRSAMRLIGMPKDAIPPLVRGVGGTPLPRPVRLYFGMGDPISTAPWAGMADDPAARWGLRGRVKKSIQDQLWRLDRIREDDPHADFVRRATRGVLDRFGRFLRPASEK